MIPTEQIPELRNTPEEKVLEQFGNIESKWKASKSYEELAQALRDSMAQMVSKIETCVCFGSGTMDRDNCKSRRTETGLARTLWQLAVFKGAIEIIEKYQGFRPSAYTQDPAYNTLDRAVLQNLRIEIFRDPHPHDFKTVTRASFTFRPSIPLQVYFKTMSRNPALHLSQEVDMVDSRTQLIMDNGAAISYKIKGRPLDYAHGVEIFDEFMNKHDMRRLPELAVTCHIRSLRLYLVKSEHK